MKTQFRSKLLSVLLVLVMVLALVPVSASIAFAASGTGTENDPVYVTNYAELKEALERDDDTWIVVNEFNNGSYYTLISGDDYSQTSLDDSAYACGAINIPTEKNKHLTINTTIDCRTASTQSGSLLYSFINNRGNLTIDGSGTLAVSFNAGNYANAIILNQGNLTIDAPITLDATCKSVQSYGRAIMNHSGTFTISDGTYIGFKSNTLGTLGSVGALWQASENANKESIISGGQFQLKDENGIISDGYALVNGGVDNLTLKGGTFYGIYASQYSLKLSALLGSYCKFQKNDADFDASSLSDSTDVLSVVNTNLIPTVNLTVTAPLNGDNPSAPSISTDNVTIYAYEWKDSSESNMSSFSTFVAGETYRLQVRVNTTKEFSKNTKVYINGQIATVKSFAENYILCYCDFIASNEQIDTVQVGLDTPMVGGNVTEPYTYTNTVDLTQHEWYPDVTQYEAGHNYRLTFRIVPKTGYEFSDDVKVVINGKQATITSQGEDFAICEYTFEFAAQEPETVDEIIITVDNPVAGGTSPTPTVSSNQYTLGMHEWTPSEFVAGSNSKLTVLAYPSSGYKFVDGTTTAKVNGQTATISIGSGYARIEYTFIVSTLSYTVSFNANGGTGSMLDETDQFGGLVLPECDFTAPTGKQFKCWAEGSTSGTQYDVGDEYDVTGDVTFFAVWEELPTFFVVYAPGEGNGSNDLDNIYEGATITLLAPADLDFTAQEGMRFAHWKVCKDNALDPNFVEKQPGDEITITFETYIIAVWEEIPTYIVSYESNGGSGTMIGDTVKEGEAFILDECDYEAPLGYKFKAWAIGALDGDQFNPGDVIPVTGEVIIYAIWEAIENFTVTYHPNGGEGEMTGATVEENSIFILGECDFTAPGNLVFKAWAIGSLEGEQKMPYDEIEITADTKIYAIWQDPPHACIAELKEGKDATCTENGWKDYYQCECGNLFADEERITPIDDLDAWKVGAGQILASHTYGNLVAEEGAVHTQTELKAGMKAHYYCAVCDTYFDENKVQTTQGALIIPAPQHVYGGFITSDPDQHWKQCTCGLKSEIADHTYDDELDNECNQCGHERDSIHECVGVLQEGKKATCTENGWKDYYQCICNKFYADQSCESEILDLEAWKVGEGKISAGHEYGDLIEKVDATCSETGKQAHYQCSVCGTLFDENKQVKTEIELTIDVDVNAHKFGDWTSNGDGTHTRVCSINGEHKQTEDCSGGEATCTERATCSICETAYGSVKAHEYGDLIEKIDATCSETGKQAHYQCSVCGTLFDENKQVKTENQLTIEVDANAHKFGDWTSNGDGTHTRVCSTNGDHKQTEDCSGGEATCTERATCSTCGNAYGSVKAHDFGTEWKNDENNHWKECACGEKSEQGAHADLDENGACDTCGRELPQATPEIKPDEPETDGLSGGAIAGIAVAGVAVAGMGGFAIFWFVIKKKTIADLIAIFKKK